MGKSLVIANVTTKLAHVHEQSEFRYDGYLVAAEHLKRGVSADVPEVNLETSSR